MESVAPTVTLAALTAHRDRVYCRRPDLRLRTVDAAAHWVDDIGFAFLFPSQDLEGPNLWHAVCGDKRASMEIRSPEMDKVWSWKDELPAQRRVFYAKLLRGKPMLVALDTAPLFYALTDNFGDVDDYLAEYEAGTLALEAKLVYEALLNHGQAASTGVLRRQAGLDGKANAGRFDRAVVQLQKSMKIVKVGISDANRWGYSYVYDLLPRAYPAIPETAQALGRREAQRGLLRLYLRNVGAIPTKQAARLFDWDAPTLDRLAADLEAEGVVRGPLADDDQDWLLWPMAIQGA